jgi:hypothetical protein
MKLGVYIMATEPTLTAYFVNSFDQSMCSYGYPPIVARQRLGKQFPAATNARNNRRIVGRVVIACHPCPTKGKNVLIIPRTQEKTLSSPTCPAQLPRDLTWDRTWTAVVGSPPVHIE